VKSTDDDNDLYFPNDKYQFMPKHGYTKMIEAILSHSNISVKLNCAFTRDMEDNYDLSYNSMSIDEYYNYQYGRLPYRTIKFHQKQLMQDVPTSVVNFTDNGPYTRMTIWEKFPLHGKGNRATLEEPAQCTDDERFYPIQDKNKINQKLYQRYAKIPNDKVKFIGRCGLYAYLDMDKAVSISLKAIK
jgi:UDP-galactopyranose mutase